MKNSREDANKKLVSRYQKIQEDLMAFNKAPSDENFKKIVQQYIDILKTSATVSNARNRDAIIKDCKNKLKVSLTKLPPRQQRKHNSLINANNELWQKMLKAKYTAQQAFGKGQLSYVRSLYIYLYTKVGFKAKDLGQVDLIKKLYEKRDELTKKK
jgi:hypothetical protein